MMYVGCMMSACYINATCMLHASYMPPTPLRVQMSNIQASRPKTCGPILDMYDTQLHKCYMHATCHRSPPRVHMSEIRVFCPKSKRRGRGRQKHLEKFLKYIG
jgi:hypothetical protein